MWQFIHFYRLEVYGLYLKDTIVHNYTHGLKLCPLFGVTVNFENNTVMIGEFFTTVNFVVYSQSTASNNHVSFTTT